MHKYKELKIWQKAIELVPDIYRATSQFLDKEKFGLTSQINSAAVSIPSNIAEGAGRHSDKEFLYFLSIAHASSYETETQLIISHNLKLFIGRRVRSINRENKRMGGNELFIPVQAKFTHLNTNI